MFDSASNYFSRSTIQQPDGRTYGERTRQAVNRTGANVTSYREFAAALVNAEDGSLITVTEAFEVPQTVLVTGNRITITCQGKGALLPAEEGLTLFSVQEADDCYFYQVKVLRNRQDESFKQFMAFGWDLASNVKRKNIIIEECYVEADRFLTSSLTNSNAGIVFLQPSALQQTNLDQFESQRNYIINNVHKSYAEDDYIVPYAASKYNAFLEGSLIMATVTGNETTGWINTRSLGTIITNNVVLGQLISSAGYTTSIDCYNAPAPNNYKTNIIANNLCNISAGLPSAPGWSTVVNYQATQNIAAPNLEIQP